jgi:hypothetical protein
MLTKGESVKGKPKEGMIGNYFTRIVKVRVLDLRNKVDHMSVYVIVFKSRTFQYNSI